MGRHNDGLVMKTIELSAPVTVTLSPTQMLLIVSGLKELPYKHAHPVIEHLYQVCQPEVAHEPQPE